MQGDQSEEDTPNFFFFSASQLVGSNENAGRFSEVRRAGRGKSFIRLITQEYSWIEGLDIEGGGWIADHLCKVA